MMKRIAIVCIALAAAPFVLTECAYHCVVLMLPPTPDFAAYQLPQNVLLDDAWLSAGLHGEPRPPHYEPWTFFICVLEMETTSSNRCMRDSDAAVAAARRWLAPHSASWRMATWHMRFWAASVRATRVANEKQLVAYTLATTPTAAPE